MQRDDSNDTLAATGLAPPGWAAPHLVLAHCVQKTLLEAVRIANQALDKLSEAAVMQLFQTMIDRTTFQRAYHEDGSIAKH